MALPEISYETFTNVFTGIAGSGTWVPYQVNQCSNPKLQTNDTGWAANGTVTGATVNGRSEAPAGFGVTYVWRANFSSGTVDDGFRIRCDISNLVVGNTYRFAFEARNMLGSASTWRAEVMDQSATYVMLASGDILPATGKEQLSVMWVATQTSVSIGLRKTGGGTTAEHVVMSKVVASIGPKPYQFYDGDTLDFVADPDSKTEWSGEANASPTTMTIQSARNITGVGVLPAVSSRDGVPALRLIATSSSNNSYAYFTVPEGAARTKSTLLGVIYQTGEIPSRGAIGGRVGFQTPASTSAQSPNAIGTFSHRLEMPEPITSSMQAKWGHGGIINDPDVYWTFPSVVAGVYEGIAFDGDSEPFQFRDRTVYPFWVGTPFNSAAAFHLYEVQPKTDMDWNISGQRFYTSGLDRGVFYPKDGPGEAWNGLVSVQESPTGGSPLPYYLDGLKIGNRATLEEFEATIEAYTAPRGFLEADGTQRIGNGLYIGQQRRKTFGFSYRTHIGNDIRGTHHAYQLHIVYGALSSPSAVSNSTMSDTVSPVRYSWKVTTTPTPFSGNRASAHVIIDSREIEQWKMTVVENILYGYPGMPAQLPTPEDLEELFNM